MAEIQTSSYSETADNNNQPAPAGFPEGMPPSGLNDASRDMMAAIKRWFNRITGLSSAGALIASAGTSTAITVAYGTAPASLYTGLECHFKVTTTCGADPTLNVNSLGAKNIQKWVGSYVNLAAGDIVATQHVKVKYDGTLDKWLLLQPRYSGATFSAHKNGSAQGSITGGGGTDVQVTWGTEVWDVGGFFGSNAWTPPAGKYRVSGCIQMDNTNGVTDEAIAVKVFVGGSIVRQFIGRRTLGTNGQGFPFSCAVDVNGSQSVDIWVNKSGAGNGQIDGTASATFFEGEAI